MTCFGYYSANAVDDSDVRELFPEYDYYLRFQANSLIICLASLLSPEDMTVVKSVRLVNGHFDLFYDQVIQMLNNYGITSLDLLKIEEPVMDHIYRTLERKFQNTRFITPERLFGH